MSTKLSRDELRQRRRRTPLPCTDHLIIAPLWLKYIENLGTLLRTCDAVGACLAACGNSVARESVARGNKLTGQPHVHWVKGDRLDWISEQRVSGKEIIAVELADNAIPLPLLLPTFVPAVVLLGNEATGIPDEALNLATRFVEIPMAGRGASLNVAVAGSLVLYRLAGMS